MSEPYAHDAPGPHLIRNGQLETDSARPFVPEPEVAADGQVPSDEPGWIVPLSTWKASRATLRRHRHPVAVRLIRPVDGVRDFVGTLCGYENGQVTIELETDIQMSFEKKEAAFVRLYEDYEAGGAREE